MKRYASAWQVNDSCITAVATSIGVASYGVLGTCTSIQNNLFLSVHSEMHKVWQRRCAGYLCKHFTVCDSSCCSL